MTRTTRHGASDAAGGTPASGAGPEAPQSFEKALGELERIVAQMEGGNLALEQALAAHKRGLELARYCQEKLEAAQQQVKVLEGEILKPLGAAMARRGAGAQETGDDD